MGRRPKCYDKAEHNRMARILVQTGGRKLDVMVFMGTEVQVDLPQSEEIEVIDHERG